MSQLRLRQQSTISSTISFASDGVDSDEEMADYYDFDEEFETDINNDSGVVLHSSTVSHRDPEYFEYSFMGASTVKKMFQEAAHKRDVTHQQTTDVTSQRDSVAKTALKRSHSLALNNNYELAVSLPEVKTRRLENDLRGECMVCYDSVVSLKALGCNHAFCSECWNDHISAKVSDGVFSRIQCMDPDCHMLLPESFVLEVINDTDLKNRYENFALREQIVSHPKLRFCPGLDCEQIVKADSPQARRVHCESCKASFCFLCGQDYHAPLGCKEIKKWVQKCNDDSETANYIATNTKDCPNCNVCIEKSGGCNHMCCVECSYDFCWMCLNPWSSHDNYYDCSRFKETENEAKSSRSALEKYIFYFHRWNNHSTSLDLEQETRQKIQDRIEAKVMNCQGTWIDWQYLLQACDLLNKCRYTLKYTYPYAYSIDAGSSKDCFEHIQAQLEIEVENLSWKVERAEITDRAELERQMAAAEKRRLTLLTDFLAK